MRFEEEAPDKSKVEYEHLKRVKEQMAAEEEAMKNTKVVKGIDQKNYKKFKDGYIPPPEQELSDEMKLKLTDRYQALTMFLGIVGLCMIFFVIYDSTLGLSILENFIIVLKIYNSMLHLSIYENYFVIKINLILLGCVLIAVNILWIIGLQYRHDKLIERISLKRTGMGAKKITHKYHGLIKLMGIAGVAIVFLDLYYAAQYISLLENFMIVLNIHNSMLNLSIFESLILKMNLILLGCALAATSLGIICFRRHQVRMHA